jgi:A-macroglobulin TED domain
LTNQLSSNWDLAKRVFEHMNVEYTAVMRRFSSQGWVKNWDHSKPNVWLTAWVIRIFQHVSFQVYPSSLTVLNKLECFFQTVFRLV